MMVGNCVKSQNLHLPIFTSNLINWQEGAIIVFLQAWSVNVQQTTRFVSPIPAHSLHFQKAQGVKKAAERALNQFDLEAQLCDPEPASKTVLRLQVPAISNNWLPIGSSVVSALMLRLLVTLVAINRVVSKAERALIQEVYFFIRRSRLTCIFCV